MCKEVTSGRGKQSPTCMVRNVESAGWLGFDRPHEPDSQLGRHAEPTIRGPSYASQEGPLPTAKVPSTVPSLTLTLVTSLLLVLATHMFAPSKTKPSGLVPTATVLSTLPSLQRNIFTLLLVALDTQMCAPSTQRARVPYPPRKSRPPHHSPHRSHSRSVRPNCSRIQSSL